MNYENIVAQSGLAYSNQPIIEEEEEEEENDARQRDTRAPKRTRTASPTSTKKTLESKRAAREREKQAKWSKIMKARKTNRDTQFMYGILEEVPTPTGPSHTNGKLNISSFHEYLLITI